MRSFVERGQDTVTMFKVVGDLCSEASIDRTPAGKRLAFAQSRTSKSAGSFSHHCRASGSLSWAHARTRVSLETHRLQEVSLQEASEAQDALQVPCPPGDQK